ncbi:MAG: SDR family oxidoreductase [Acidobacteriota bacterium]
MADDLILLTGATGYVGGRLLTALEARGLAVRCLARRPAHLDGRLGQNSQAVAGDVLDPASLEAAFEGVTAAYYLVHSMGSTGEFEEQDRRAAESFARAAEAAGVRRIIYLGGLGQATPGLSAHLRSRHEVGEILRAGAVPVVELRASIVIGPGSLSFEMVRALVERLPVMITPRWVDTPAQPIAIADLLAYLLAALDLDLAESRIFEIGGAEVVSYGGIMREYARQRGLWRRMIRVPVLSPRLSSLWLGLVTPLYARVGRKLVDSMRHATVVTDDAAAQAFAIRPMGLRTAIEKALRGEEREFAAPRWSDALSAAGPVREWGGVRFGNRLVDSRRLRVNVPPAAAFVPIRRIGGTTGWYFGDWLWHLRGALDLLFGGVGIRRGRVDPEQLRVGDVLDCWRVETFESDHRLVLSAEMLLPGRAWLEFEVTPDGSGSLIQQTASFDPIGLAGLAYWYSVWPLHQVIFEGMLRAIGAKAGEGGP